MLALGSACSSQAEDASETAADGPGGKADDPSSSALCPAEAAINAGEGTAKRCYDPSNGQFVPSECCTDLCEGAGIREQANGERCAWLDEPGLPGAVIGQFAPSLCCALNDEQACARAEGEPGSCIDPESGNVVEDVCCDADPEPPACHPAIAGSINMCIYAQIEGHREQGEPVPNLLSLFDSCTSEFDALFPQIDARCEFQPELAFCGLDVETVANDFVAPCATEQRAIHDCAFGVSFFDTLRQSHMTLVDKDELRLAQATVATPLVQQQITAAVGAGHELPVSLDEAFERVDGGVVNHIEMFDLSSSRGYTIVEFGAGDTSVGAIFATGTTEMVAVIGDGDISLPGTYSGGCNAPIGPGGNFCSVTEDCAPGFNCEGRIQDENPIQTPLGLCIDQSVNTNNESCTELRGCGEGQYCTGLSAGDDGFCGGGWMFGERTAGEQVEAPDGGSARGDVLVYGQATVPMDLELTLELFHASDTDELQVELLIPGPTDGTDEDRARITVWPREGVNTSSPTYGRVTLAANAFGDEGINGKWTILVTDTSANGQTGGVYDWSMRYSSRFD